MGGMQWLTVMQKTINKLWAVLTLGMVSVFIAFAFASKALTISKELKSDFEFLDSKMDAINKKMESIRDRPEDVESKINLDEMPNKLNGNPLGAKLSRLKDQVVQKENNGLKKNGIVEELQKQASTVSRDLKTITYLGQKNAFSSYDDILKAFHSTLSDEDLAELDTKVEASIIAQLNVAASDANFSNEEADEFKKMIIEEDGDLFRDSEEKAQLMEMMLKAVENGEFKLVP